MARLDEIAEGIAKVLRLSAAPEPLPLDLVGEGPVETTVLVRSIIDASQRHEAPIARVCLDPRLGARLFREHGEDYKGVKLEPDNCLGGRIEIWRFPAD